MENLLSDNRFAHVARDPKFRRIPKAERKIKIDKRFQGMFKDKKFNVKYTIDKRGRPVNQTSSENLRKYYDLSDSENESDIDVKSSKKNKKDKQKFKEESEDTNDKKAGESLNDSESEIQSGKDDEDSSTYDNCPSSNGSLLLIKPQEQQDSESGRESWDTDTEEVNRKNLKEHLDENEKQLHTRRKNESGELTDEIKKKLRDLTVNYARGEGTLITDSSSDEESSEYSDEEDIIEHNWGELDKEAETTNEITRRLAVCNMDWDRIRAVDLIVLFNSFLPSSGLIHSVTIYPSQFGLERMKEEEVKGPIELVESKKISQDDNDDDNEDPDDSNEGSKYHMEKLRQYQLNRLKYYYAVVECDSPETANKIYTECDGVEYESTATKMDLRFIPDDMTFDEEPKETCTEVPKFTTYQPRQFTTTALQQVKVDLTWDETNPQRQEITQKLSSGKIDELNENDIQAYLASGSSDDEDNKDAVIQEDEAHSDIKTDPIAKYKSLLKSIEDKEEAKKQKDVELEFTWGLGATEKAEKLVKERMTQNEELTPFQKYLEKRKAKNKAKREERKESKEEKSGTLSDSEDDIPSDIDLSDPYFAELKKMKSKKKKNVRQSGDASTPANEQNDQQKAELELLLMDKNEDEDKQHFNMKKIEENATLSKSKKKRLMKKKKDTEKEANQDNFEVDVEDPRFSALFTSHHFNIDPADPHYRKTKGTDALVNEKLKRRADNSVINEIQPKQPKTNKKLNTELQALVKSVKKNAQNISQPIK